jgi:putative transposase
LETVADMLGQQFPKVKQMLLDAKDDLTAFADFPERHWKKIQSTNPLERINREIKRRIDVVQVFPNDDALLRLVTAVLFEMHDEWIALPRRHLPEGDMGDICRKLSFGSSVLPNAPKCNRQLIPNAMTRDTTWRMRVPDRVALASVSSRAGHRRPFAQRLLGS